MPRYCVAWVSDHFSASWKDQLWNIPEWAKKQAVVLRVVTSSIMDQFKEIPLLESLLNFDANHCRVQFDVHPWLENS